ALMDDYLGDVVSYGTATRARVVKNARGKTGTTQENKDAWFCGYTDDLVGIGWVANEQPDPKRKPPVVYKPMASSVMGGKVTAEMWTNIMAAAQKKLGTGKKRIGKPLERDVDVTAEIRRPDAEISYRSQGSAGVPPSLREEEPPPRRSTTSASVPPALADENEPAPAPVNTPAPRRNTTPAENVSVEVCADTNLRATIYCPETITRRFSAGREPSRWCRRHGP
ncbi:MAG TPA: hypothetical protein VEX38_07895, partial [Fimbriimonadaceae bacterium]|nr:hypothetical protein [Fimbriimonadaceae bacterium]